MASQQASMPGKMLIARDKLEEMLIANDEQRGMHAL